MKIYISGLYSGTNPQPGVGIARSVRAAYPDATIIGVEYSNRCSGIHWNDFDEIWLQRPWEEINIEVHAGEIKKVLDSGALWISSIDLEIMWLAKSFPDGHPNLLIPPITALEQVSKPAIPAHDGFPVKISPFISTQVSDWELHAFCREHNWMVWLKGPYYDAVRVRSWAQLVEMRHLLSTAWATEDLFLQAHVSGYEESISLSAYQGELLDCVWMRKRDLTEIGKTWSGDISEVEPELREPLCEIISRIGWTGGAELEMIRDTGDGMWLLEWNPRYPAWIHGATITGRNIPAKLIEAASGVPGQKAASQGNEFTRVVLEIPLRPQYPLSPLPEPFPGEVGHSMKHPSGLLQFAGMLHKDEKSGSKKKTTTSAATPVPDTFIEDLNTFDLASLSTPTRIFLENTAAKGFRDASARAEAASTDTIRVTNAYSIKTDPDERLIRLALESGFYAEAISIPEVRKALDVGFRPDQIVLNGPAKWWQKETLAEHSFFTVFCDSLNELDQAIDRLNSGGLQTEYIGLRIRTPNVVSRFGISIATPDEFNRVIDAVRRIPQTTKLGVHFHMASSNIGIRSWEFLFQSILRWCSSLEALTGRLIEVLDIGGGWFPEDMDGGADEGRLKKAVASIPDLLPHVKQVLCEPGKALAQPSMALAMQILEIRDEEEHVHDVVVDGSIAELPMHFFYPHRILTQNGSDLSWTPLERGKTRLLGRLCMEHDIVASNVELPKSARVGDILVVCDAGAYDRSMSYVFGRG
ncbi:MAG: hypothetical protein JO053_01715 [Acidobacteria bacterium]|nr:hypothetical protein [Acidobacteriota bacterium]